MSLGSTHEVVLVVNWASLSVTKFFYSFNSEYRPCSLDYGLVVYASFVPLETTFQVVGMSLQRLSMPRA